MLDARLVVVSCPTRKPIQQIWTKCHAAHWPDCPLPVDILSPEPDRGWNANLIRYLEKVKDTYVLLMLDDHFIAEDKPNVYTHNLNDLLLLMNLLPNIGMVKLQAGNAWPPEIEFPQWNRLREYDRAHHPFKRTNLVPTMFRRAWLHRLSSAVLENCGAAHDQGRKGALEFEVQGTLLTEDTKAWPERMLGIHRPHADGGGGDSLLNCIDNDAVREGRLKLGVVPVLEKVMGHLEGVEAFL